MRALLGALRRSGLIGSLAGIVGWLAAAVIALLVIVWIGNPYIDDIPEVEDAAPSWAPPPPVDATTTEPSVPLGFPSMAFPPPMVDVSAGEQQSVPTRYGLSYSVPRDGGWRPSNSRTIRWSHEGRTIASYGSMSDYGYGYCEETDGSSLAKVGVRGRNAVDLDTAARDEIAKAGPIFADTAGNSPNVDIRGPVPFEVGGRAAVRYTAVVTEIVGENRCDPSEARFDVVATRANATAEVMLLVLERHVGLPDALDEHTAEEVLASLASTQ